MSHTNPTFPLRDSRAPFSTSFLMVCIELPFGVSVERARAAIREKLQTTPEEVLGTVVEDSVTRSLASLAPFGEAREKTGS